METKQEFADRYATMLYRMMGMEDMSEIIKSVLWMVYNDMIQEMDFTKWKWESDESGMFVNYYDQRIELQPLHGNRWKSGQFIFDAKSLIEAQEKALIHSYYFNRYEHNLSL